MSITNYKINKKIKIFNKTILWNLLKNIHSFKILVEFLKKKMKVNKLIINYNKIDKIKNVNIKKFLLIFLLRNKIKKNKFLIQINIMII
jgi:hypothetical protein